MDNLPANSSEWFDREVNIDAFNDKRLGERLRTFLVQLASRIGNPIPLACEDWANTKAAYRFLSNGSVGEGEILSGHFTSTCQRAASTDGLLLVLQDTTEFIYKRANPAQIGAITSAPVGRDLHGRLKPAYLTGF